MDKITNSINIEVPQGFVDEGDGLVSFPGGLTITDGSVQRNGTRYDIDSLDISRYGNQLTGDHKDELGNLIGKTIGVVKQNGKVIVNAIQYAVKENPYARLAYQLLVGGFSKNFSTETIGPKPDDNAGIYWNAELVGLSQVVTQNNYNAHINKVVHNALELSKQDGLDVDNNELLTQVVADIEQKTVKEENKMEEKDKKVEASEIEVKEAEEVTVIEDTETEIEQPEVKSEETEVAENAIEEDETEEQKESEEIAEEVEVAEEVEEVAEAEQVEVIEDAEEVKDAENEISEDEKETNNKETEMTKEEIAEVIANALKPIAQELATVREEAKNAFDASAKEIEFKKDENAVEEVVENKFAAMAFEDRYQAQVDAAWNAVKLGNVKAWDTLRQINEVNLEGLKKAGIARNAITLDDLGNFVIPEEMYREIQGHRNDYTAILNATEWRETLSLEFAWLERVGDIDMQSVAIGSTIVDGTPAASDDERLKPISEYSAVPRKSQLEELAAVTVVATSTTRFAAVDLLADAAQGYRTDYDRKRAQLVLARLEQAVDSTGYSVAYNPASDVDALTVWLEAITEISDTTLNGTLIFNARTYAELKTRALQAGANGPWAELLTTGEIPMVFGYRYIIVPNDLMPSLGGSETINFLVDGETVRINHAVFFAELTTFTGRTSGGLQYDVSNSASYEVGNVVKSAYQRNELVLRGSFFRGGAVKDREVVAGIRQGAGANLS